MAENDGSMYGGDGGDPSPMIRAITKSDTVNFPEGPCRGVNCDAEGTANIVDMTGTVISDYFMSKGYNPISLKRVNTGGTAGNMWALY